METCNFICYDAQFKHANTFIEPKYHSTLASLRRFKNIFFGGYTINETFPSQLTPLNSFCAEDVRSRWKIIPGTWPSEHHFGGGAQLTWTNLRVPRSWLPGKGICIF